MMGGVHDGETRAAMIRDWLAATLIGDSTGWALGDGFNPTQVLATAAAEGVVALLHERLLDPRMAAMPAALREPLAVAARVKAAQSLVRENQCRLILARFAQAGLPVLLLKGSALAYWAYTSPYLRECSDIDLLFRSRGDVDRAVAILAELRYELRQKVLPGDLVCFEGTCVRGDGLEVDLHWRLSSTPLFAFRFDWTELEAAAIALPALALNARGLAPVPAFMHACMHRVQNMAAQRANVLKWLYDLALLARGFTPADWECLTALATARGLAGTCLDGIEAATACFGGVAPESVHRALAEAARAEIIDVRRMHQWWYIQRMSFHAFPEWRQRWRWLRQRVIPDPRYLRERYGQGSTGRSMVARMRAALGRLRG